MKDISQSPRSRAQKVTSKSLQRVMISSGLSIALCMGCIAGSAWSLFQSDFTVESTLSLAGLNPKIVDSDGNELLPVPGDTNTFLLHPNKEYKLSLSYDSTEDDLGIIWDVDALLVFRPAGTPQLVENHDLPAPEEPESQPTEPESTEPESEGETETPEVPQTPDEGENVPEQTPGEEPTNPDGGQSTDGVSGSEGEPEKTEEEKTDQEIISETPETDNTVSDQVTAQSDGEQTDTEGEGSGTGENGTNGEGTNTEGSTTGSGGTNSGADNTPSAETQTPSENTTNEEDAEEKERKEKIKKLQEMLLSESVDTLKYPVPMVRESDRNHFSVEGIQVRQKTFVTFQTVKLISAEATAKAGAYSFDTVPNYYQNDYPDTMYGSGTVASSGCSAVSLAMIATYMTDHPYLPDEMARYFGGAAENNIARLEKGLQTLQIPYEKPANIDIAYEELLKGKVGIALMDYNSYFTNSQHFIVLKGVTEDGKILVNDPNRDNESIYPIGFSEGFTKGTITTGYLGAWLFDKSQMPEEPFIYHVPEPVHGIPRYPDIHITASQKQVIAKIVYLEARGESPEGQQAVAEVILNRLASNRFGLTLKDVIFGEGQFRTTELLDTADPYQAQYDAIERAIWGPYVLPSDVYYFAREPMTNNVWGKIGNHVFTGAPIRNR